MKKKYQLILIGILLLIPDPIPFVDEGVLLAFFMKTLTDLVKERRIGGSTSEKKGNDEKGPIIDID